MGLDSPGRAVKSNVSKSFSTGKPAFLIRVPTALAARAASSSSVRLSRNWAKVWLPDAASRAQLLELLAHRRQAKLSEVGLEQLGRDVDHRHGPFR